MRAHGIGSLLSLSLAALLSACGGDDGNTDRPIKIVPDITPAEAEELLNNAEVYVADVQAGDPLPMGVGLLATVDYKSAGQCTASLISPNVVLTNSHCIPKAVKDGNSCAKRIRFILPDLGDGQDAGEGDCESVSYFSPIIDTETQFSKIVPDYAFIRLDRDVMGRMYKISQEGFVDGEDLYALTVDPLETRSISGELKVKKCRTVVESMIFPVFNNAFSAVGAIADCQIIPGNSGSPTITKNGMIKGVVSHTVKPEHVNKISKFFNKTDHSTHYGMMANAACAEKNPVAQQTRPQGCKAWDSFYDDKNAFDRLLNGYVQRHNLFDAIARDGSIKKSEAHRFRLTPYFQFVD